MGKMTMTTIKTMMIEAEGLAFAKALPAIYEKWIRFVSLATNDGKNMIPNRQKFHKDLRTSKEQYKAKKDSKEGYLISSVARHP